MNFFSIHRRESFGKILYGFGGLVLTLTLSLACFAQQASEKPAEDKSVLSEPAYGVKVTQIDDAGLKNLLKPNGKPLLVNFWATWCEPCREEFPDLVKIDKAFRGKIDFVTVSLDDAEEINDDVPKFLQTMKAEMPAFLLKTPDETEVISAIAKDWQGGLPFTILYNEKGETAYFKQGKVKFDILQTEIKKILTTNVSQTELPMPKIRSTEEGKADAEKDIAKGILQIKRYGMTMALSANFLQDIKQKYGVEIVDTGCVLVNTNPEYFIAYNQTVREEILRKFGAKALEVLKEVSFE